jgi:predicted Holliday junction resolvase-like endonuclease
MERRIFMNLAKEAHEVIRTLESSRSYAQCPCCEEPIFLKDAGLFYLDDFSPDADKLYQQLLQDLKGRKKGLQARREAIPRISEGGAKAVNIGFILERIAPSMNDFPFDRNDCRSLFDPIDYVIFEGLNKKGSVTKILFADIKTGGAQLRPRQKEIRDLVERKRVVWETYETRTKS